MKDNRSIEKVTPAKAQEYLETSQLKRSVSERTVSGYAALMARGMWQSYPPIEFDAEGRLVNGHHRLHAIIRAGIPVELEVVRDVPPEVHAELDTGRPRAMQQLFKMYRTKVEYPTYRAAAVKLAARLLTGTEQRVRSLIEYDMWEKPFKAGVTWAAKNLWGVNYKAVKTSGVSGALVFAYRHDPEKVAEFAEKLISGEGLKAGEPPLVLRNALAREAPGMRSGGGEGRAVLARQVLNTVMAYINNETMNRLSSDDAGRQFFLEAYKRTQKIALDAAE